MNTLPIPPKVAVSESWRGFAASIPGSGHIRYGIPCQDASLVLTSPRPALIVCDGRGSAAMSHFGSQGATAAFKRQLSIMEPFLARILDREEGEVEQWEKFCRILYRTLWQVQLDLAEEREQEPKEFDFTVALAVVGKCRIGCFQVGDGSIVLRQNGVCRTVFPPEKGEFANQTHFLRQGGEGRLTFQRDLFPAKENSGIAITSDGPEHLMFRLSDMMPGKVFDCFFDDLAAGEFCRQDLMDYLTDRGWNDDPRGADDRSVALLIPPIAKVVPPEAEQNPTDETAKPAPPVTEPEAADESAAASAAVEESPVAASVAEDTAAEQSPETEAVPDSPELSQQPPDVVSSPRQRGGLATYILAVLLALTTAAGVGYGWHLHSRLVAAERSHAVSVGDLRTKLASSENETKRLRSELQQVKTASRPDSTAAPAAHDPVPPEK